MTQVTSGYVELGDGKLYFEAAGRGTPLVLSHAGMRIWIDGPAREPEQVNPLVRQRAGEMSRAALAKGPWGQADAKPLHPLEPPATQRLGEIHVPTLIIAGALDDPEILRSADVMAAAIPRAQKVIIPDSAHLLNMEQPAEFNRAVMRFLHSLA